MLYNGHVLQWVMGLNETVILIPVSHEQSSTPCQTERFISVHDGTPLSRLPSWQWLFIKRYLESLTERNVFVRMYG